MNIKDIDKVDKFEGDKLDQIFEGQRTLMEDYKGIAEKHFSIIFKNDSKIEDKAWEGGDHNLHTREGNFLLKEMITATIQELAEAVQVLKNWKAWKQTEVPSDVDHFKEEMVDGLHFYVEALILSGVTADELHDLYFKKREVNKFRQESKY